MPTIDLGSVVGPQGEQGNTGPQGEQGVAGPSLISASTQTTLTGVLAGDGSTVGVRAVDSTPTANSNNLVSSGGVYTKITTDVANAYQRTCNPNLLDNWYFVGGGTGNGVFPVNQRGQTSYSGAVYTIDRWKMREANNSFSMDASGISLAKGSSANQCDFFQTLEQGTINALIGKTVTASILWADGTMSFESGVWDSSIVTLLNETAFALYVGGNSTAYYNFCFRTKGSYTNKIVAAKLELGNTQTLAHQENGVWVLNEIPNYAEEYQKCLRYFWNAKFPSTAAGQYVAPISNFAATSSTSASCHVTCPVAMRTAPTVSGTLQYIRGTEMGSAVNLTSGFTLGETANLQGNTANFTVTHGSHSFPGLSTGLYGLFTALTLSAEL